MCVLFSAKF